MAAFRPDLLLEQLGLLIEQPGSLSQDDPQRAELLRLTRLASTALETPLEVTQRIIFSPLPLLTTRLSQEFNIFSTLAQHSVTHPVGLSELAKASGLEPSILSAVMDYNCGQSAALEAKPGHYAPTKLTHMMLQPMFNDATIVFYDCVLPTFAALCRVLKDTGKDRLTAFQAGHNTSEEDIYSWLESHPVQQGAFYRFMKTVFAGLPTWLDVVRFDEEIGANSSSNEVLFVDVGGGFGWQCQALRKAYPHLPGKIILQDRADVIKKGQAAEEAAPNKQLGVEPVVYDFFTEQTVKGARAYFLRGILHNWDDEKCIQILKCQASAMATAGKSTMIIEDFVLGEREPGADYAAAFGIAMQAVHNARERSREDFERLLGLAGLELVEVRAFTKFGNSAILARKQG
ncbi:S-adenosyl-L-methionine-dependent methyltransferase [Decorospora gaudefroyi]|uniref:S-adenosyl-L-methionine-dependent methyltransferase n=1 Tax=Decorospora gaudefroyi TaxID=184978 RepID=A0A6A5KWD7_9PLEO|nr:S-adenosyl-L-methionine-dependent methyltransferase [Decorospora gaudefroyi]